MARKKSVGGRARQVQSLAYQVERANRQLRKLEQAGELSTYSARKLQKNIAPTRGVTVSRRTSRKRPTQKRIKVSSAIARGDKLYLQKQLKTFLESETATTTGVRRKRERVRKNIRKGLGELVDRRLTNKDVDDFYDLLYDEDFKYFSDKMSESDVYALLDEAKEENRNVRGFIKNLETEQMTMNSAEAQEKAKRLYRKFKKL